MKKPCDTCTSVNAATCENKECEKWRQWFIGWWDGIRQKYLKGGDV